MYSKEEGITHEIHEISENSNNFHSLEARERSSRLKTLKSIFVLTAETDEYYLLGMRPRGF